MNFLKIIHILKDERRKREKLRKNVTYILNKLVFFHIYIFFRHYTFLFFFLLLCKKKKERNIIQRPQYQQYQQQ